MTQKKQERKERRPALLEEAVHAEPPCPTPLTREILERVSTRPADPRAPVSITPKCHRDAGMTAGYCWADGCVVLACDACGAGVCRIQLAAETPS